ncbi:MAG: P-II family nitrogen regulator [Planctomycetes bacterium]|nr:P-II family nitrogen regulator [Planctomycetota bacterium]
MKMVIAFIKKNKFDEVMLALHKIEGLTGASSSEVHGFGRDRSRNGAVREPEISLEYIPHIKLEIACHSELVNQVVSVIKETAHTGLHGDGKIYVLPLEQSVRIRTGEQGENAI